MMLSSGIGAAAAPWIAQWLSHFHISLPFAMMGGLAVISALLCLMLKETKGLETTEVLEIAETGPETAQNNIQLIFY